MFHCDCAMLIMQEMSCIFISLDKAGQMHFHFNVTELLNTVSSLRRVWNDDHKGVS